MRTTNAKTVAEALIQYFSRLGIPDEIVSDQGSNFMSKLLAQLYQERSQDFSKGGVIECLINNSYFFYTIFFCLGIFCRVRYCVTFIVAVGTLLFVIKLIR